MLEAEKESWSKLAGMLEGIEDGKDMDVVNETGVKGGKWIWRKSNQIGENARILREVIIQFKDMEVKLKEMNKKLKEEGMLGASEWSLYGGL